MRDESILVIMGGKSTEREISLKSGKAVASALREKFKTVTELDLSRESLFEIEKIAPDAAFIALHGKGGEDGTVQGVLEWMQIPYTGPGVLASALCLDKIMTKKVLALSGVPTPKFLTLEKGDPALEIDRAVGELGLPLVLKAARQGSSIGVAIVREREGAEEILSELFGYGDEVLAEAFLSGMELTVPVMGNDTPQVLPIIEITSNGAFYDFQSKYTPGESRHIIPARITKEQEEAIRAIAARAYTATLCRGLARVDFMMDRKGQPQVIEINTSPGMTATSLFPDAAAHAGIDFPTLCETLIDLALE